MTPLKRAVSSSTCCCDRSCRAKKTCSYNGMRMPLHGFAPIRRQAPRAFRERLESLRRREHGTSDHTALPASLRTKALLEALDGDSGRPFSSRPGSSGSRRYRGFDPECNPKSAEMLLSPARPVGVGVVPGMVIAQ